MPEAFDVKVETEGVDRLIAALTARSRAAARVATQRVVVGYDCPYAIYVHEDLTAQHPNGGQAKFLEQPARTLRTQLSNITYQALRRGATVIDAEMEAGQALLAASQKLVPVDTGRLRDSGFVAVE